MDPRSRAQFLTLLYWRKGSVRGRNTICRPKRRSVHESLLKQSRVFDRSGLSPRFGAAKGLS